MGFIYSLPPVPPPRQGTPSVTGLNTWNSVGTIIRRMRGQVWFWTGELLEEGGFLTFQVYSARVETINLLSPSNNRSPKAQIKGLSHGHSRPSGGLRPLPPSLPTRGRLLAPLGPPESPPFSNAGSRQGPKACGHSEALPLGPHSALRLPGWWAGRGRQGAGCYSHRWCSLPPPCSPQHVPLSGCCTSQDTHTLTHPLTQH